MKKFQNATLVASALCVSCLFFPTLLFQDSNVSPVVHFAPDSPRGDCGADSLPPPPGLPPPPQPQAGHHQYHQQQQQLAGGGQLPSECPQLQTIAGGQQANNRLQVVSPRPAAASAVPAVPAVAAAQRKNCIQNPEVQVLKDVHIMILSFRMGTPFSWRRHSNREGAFLRCWLYNEGAFSIMEPAEFSSINL